MDIEVRISKLIAFAEKNGLTIELEDASMIDEIDLSLLKIAQTAIHGMEAMDLEMD